MLHDKKYFDVKGKEEQVPQFSYTCAYFPEVFEDAVPVLRKELKHGFIRKLKLVDAHMKHVQRNYSDKNLRTKTST